MYDDVRFVYEAYSNSVVKRVNVPTARHDRFSKRMYTLCTLVYIRTRYIFCRSFVRSFVRSLVRSFVRSFVGVFVRSFVDWLRLSFIISVSRRSFVCRCGAGCLLSAAAAVRRRSGRPRAAVRCRGVVVLTAYCVEGQLAHSSSVSSMRFESPLRSDIYID